MRELLVELIDRLDRGPIALARVVATSGATPRIVGSAMAVTDAGDVLGSLSGGCVESAVVESAAQVIATGAACSEQFASDPGEFGVGLVCGGEIEVFIERIDHTHRDTLRRCLEHITARRSVGLATSLGDHPRWEVVTDNHSAPGSFVGEHRLDRDAGALLAAGRSGIVGTDDSEEPASEQRRMRTFVQAFAPPDRLIIAGANDFARALSVAARPLGWWVSVVDARSVFTTAARFPAADDVVVDWPHRYLQAHIDSGATDSRTAIAVMTHDTKFDVPLLEVALRSDVVGFVGALGSRRTHADRMARLRDRGLRTDELARLRAPIGLDLGGHTPAETAIAILAEMIAWRNGASATALTDGAGPIHRRHS